MNKKFLSASISSALALGLVFGAAIFSQDSAVGGKVAHRQLHRNSSVDFGACTELTRDAIRVDMKSATATSGSKSTTVEFTSVRVTGFGTSKKTAYVVVDDENYSGDPSNASLDPTASKPYNFNGYTIELADIAASANLVVPKQMTYGTSFAINNTKIIEGALSLSTNPKINTIVIPKEIVEIESNALDLSYYSKTSDTEIDSGKTYFERDGKTYVEVTSPVVANIENYYEHLMSDVEIKCEAASKPTGWAADWCNADASKITFGYELTTDEVKAAVQSTGSNTKEYGDPTMYILGYQHTKGKSTYYCKTDEKTYQESEIADGHKCPDCHGDLIEIPDSRPEGNYPLMVSYNVLDVNTSAVRRNVTVELPVTQADASKTVAFNSTKTASYSRSIDILLEDGEKLDYESFTFANIFKAKKVTVTGVDSRGNSAELTFDYPDTTVNYKARALKRFTSEIDVNQIINYRFESVTTFGDYTCVSMLVDKVLPSYYETAMASQVSTHKDKIESGAYYIRYAIYDLSNSSYSITYKSKTGENVTKDIKISTTVPTLALEKNKDNRVAFLIKNSDVGSDFKASALRRFELVSLTINMHLWSRDNNSIVARTPYSVHFGGIDVLPEITKAPNTFSIVTFMVIFYAVYLVAYAGATYGLFRFFTEKYKNDEFRRVKPKAFFKNAAIGLAGSCVVILTVLSIIFRFGLFNNSIAVFNPIDPFVVLSGIVSIVIVGYFIVYVMKAIKTEKKRRETIKLKLNEDVENDGTN